MRAFSFKNNPPHPHYQIYKDPLLIFFPNKGWKRAPAEIFDINHAGDRMSPRLRRRLYVKASRTPDSNSYRSGAPD